MIRLTVVLLFKYVFTLLVYVSQKTHEGNGPLYYIYYIFYYLLYYCIIFIIYYYLYYIALCTISLNLPIIFTQDVYTTITKRINMKPVQVQGYFADIWNLLERHLNFR